MPTKCPLKSLSEWKSLQSDLGSYALAMQAYELNGEEIPSTPRAKELLLGTYREAYDYSSDGMLARERFNIPALKKIGSGSDRDVFDLGNGRVLKVAKTARGLEQNDGEGNWYLGELVPEQYEKGRNYVVVENVPKLKPTDKITTYDVDGNEIGEVTAKEMMADLLSARWKMYARGKNDDHVTSEVQDILYKYGMIDFASVNILWGDLSEIRNWGYRNGQPVHVDGGTFQGMQLLTTFQGKKDLSDPEFRKIYYESKAKKLFYGDKDKFGRYQREEQFQKTEVADSKYKTYNVGGEQYSLIDTKDGLSGIPVVITGDTFTEVSEDLYEKAVRFAEYNESLPYQGQEEKHYEELQRRKAEYEAALRNEYSLSDFSGGAVESRGRATGRIRPRPISSSSAKFLQKIISAVFPGVTVKFLTQQEYNDKFGNDTNAVVGADGIVYFNSAKINASTQVHEFGHVWSSWAKRYAPKLYQQGLALAKADTALMERVGRLYPKLTGEALLEEALATMIGEQGALMLDPTIDNEGNIDQRTFLRKLWDSIRAFMLKNFGVKLGSDFYGDTIGQFSATVASKLLRGKKISDFTSEDIANIESDLGISRAQVTYNDSYENDFFRNDTGVESKPILEASWQDNSQWLTQDLFDSLNAGVMEAQIETLSDVHKAEIRALENRISALSAVSGNDPAIAALKGDIMDIIRANATLDTNALIESVGPRIVGQWFGETINDIEEKVNDRGLHTGKKDESPLNKASDKELSDAKDKAVARGYDADFKIIAQQIYEQHDFDRANLPEATRKLWNKMVSFRQRQQYLAMNSDDIIINDQEKVSADDLSVIVQAQIDRWTDKLQKYKNNKYLLPAIELIEKYMMKVANMRLWVQLQTGMKSGPLWELMKGMHRGSATASYIRYTGQDMLQPLYKADWLKDGSQTMNRTAKLSELETQEFGGVPLTTEEQFNIFMVLQQRNVRGALMGTEANPKQAKFYVEEFKGERDGQVVKISYEDYQELLAKFDEHWDEVNGSWGSTARYIFGKVQDTYKLENGVLLGSTINQGDPAEKWNIYFPIVHGEGQDAIKTFMKSNSFVNDISSHKSRSPSSSEVYYAGGALATMEAYVDDNAQYIGFAMPVRNMNLFMKKNEEFFKDKKMQKYVEWWNFTRENIFNPTQSILGSIEQQLLEAFVISRLGLNPFVFLKQFTSIPLASTVIPAKYIKASMGEFFGTLKDEFRNYDTFSEWMGRDKQMIATLEEMKTYSPYALSRLTHGVNEMEKHILAHENTFTKYFEKVTGKKIQMDDFMKWIRSADAATGAMMWSASKKMVTADMGLVEGTDEYWRAVDDLYTEAVIESQSSIDEINRPMFPKEGTLFAKSLSLFAGQTFSNFNAMASRFIEYANDPSAKNKMKFYQSFMNVIVVNALMVAAVDTLRSGAIGVDSPDKDEMDIFGEKFTRAMYQNIPIIAPVVDAVVSKYENPVFGRDFGYPIFEVVNDGAAVIANGMRGKEDKAIREMVYFGAGLTGLPMTPIRAGEAVLK